MTPEWPRLGGSAYQGITGDVVMAIEPHTEADPVAVLLSFLAYAGALIGGGPHAFADGAEHPARLNVALVGRTSDGRKGSSNQNVRRVMAVADPGFVAKRVLGGFGSGEVLVDEVRDPDPDRNDPGASDRRLLVYEPELARMLRVAARDGSTLSTTVRDAWDGGRLQARSRAQTSCASFAFIAVLGHITPDELRRHLSETEIAAGLGNRFLFAMVRRSKRLPEGGNLDESVVHDLGHAVRLRLERARRRGRLHRSDEGRTRWAELYNVMADQAQDGIVGALTARAEAQVLRLSVLYALLDDDSKTIDVRHIDAAWAVWCYCRESVEYLYAGLTGDAVADTLMGALRDVYPRGLDGTEVAALFSGHVSAKRLNVARDVLVGQGLARTETEPTGGRPRVLTYALANKEKKAKKA